MTAPKYKPYSVAAYNEIKLFKVVEIGFMSSHFHDRKKIIGAIVTDSFVEGMAGVWDNSWEYGDFLTIKSVNEMYPVGKTNCFYQVKTVPYHGRIC